MQARPKKWIFALLLAILALPAVQQSFPFVTSGPLKGVFTIATPVRFSWRGWINANYQDSAAAYLNDHTGLRPDLIRASNQVEYSLFNKAHSEWRIIAGKNNTAYQDVYIYAYTGKDFTSNDTIRSRMIRLRAIQDTLQRLGKTILLIHAPGKAWFYPENIPAEYLAERNRNTNLASYLRLGDSAGVNQLDFNSWFVGLKKNSKELLYPRQGFHWSVYGSWLAADSLIRYMEHQRHTHMLHPVMGCITHTNKPRDTDYDLGDGLNIIFPAAVEMYSYPEIKYSSDTPATKPKVIFIGDSFILTWMNSGFMDNAFSDWQIWYYWHHLLNRDNRDPEKTPLNNTDLFYEINKTDCIVLMYTSRNLVYMSDGFIEQAYNHYYPGKR